MLLLLIAAKWALAHSIFASSTPRSSIVSLLPLVPATKQTCFTVPSWKTMAQSGDLHVLSTPPAFNLSQNQTLQFKSVAKISVGTEIRISKFFPTRSSLVNEPCALSFGARSVSTLPFAACQLLFFDFRKFLFGIVGSFSPPRNSSLRKFRATCQDFFQFRDTFASLAVRLNRRRRTLRRCPPFVKLFVESFLFFLIEGPRRKKTAGNIWYHARPRKGNPR